MTTSRERPVVLKDLYKILASSVRVVVKDSPTHDAMTLFESTDKKDLDDLQRSVLLETPATSFHCMCFGSPAIYLEGREGELVELTNHHGKSVRCSLWASDVRILDTEKWLSWFDHRGMPEPRQEVERMRTSEEGNKADWNRWLAAMPEPIAPLWSKVVIFNQFVDVKVEPLRAALERGLPNEKDRILVLLEWFGSGAGPWSGFPYYECAAEELLLEYPTTSIVEAIQLSSTTSRQTEGAARLFAGGSFHQQRPGGLDEVPDALKRSLWNYVKETKDTDKLRQATCAFTQ